MDQRKAIPPRPMAVVSTRRPLGSHPDAMPQDPASLTEWLTARLAMVDARGEQTHDVVVALRTEVSEMRNDMRSLRAQQTAQAGALLNMIDVVGTPPNDATGKKGTGMAGQLAELVSANRHAIQAGAITAGGVVGVAQIALWALAKAFGHG